MTIAEKESAEQPLRKPPGYHETQKLAKERPTGKVKPLLPTSFYPEKKKRRCSRRRICCCCVFISLLVLIFLILISAAVFYLWFNPKFPVFRLGSFKIQKFNISGDGFDDGWSQLTAQTSSRLDIKNPNGKLRFIYGDADVDVFVGKGEFETGIGSARVLGFRQGPMNTTVVKVLTSVKKQKVDDTTSKRLTSDFKSKGMIVRVEGKMKVGLGVGKLTIGMLGISLRCGHVSLKSLDSQMARCTINTLRWINIR